MTASPTTSSPRPDAPPPAVPTGALAGNGGPSSYRFLRTPRWLVGHVVAALLAVALVNLGLWQLRRLDERREHNSLLAARTAAPVVDVAAEPEPADPDVLVYREGAATGTYVADEEVLVRSRSLNGSPGAWVLTPLLLADGRAVVVNRGWIPAVGHPTLPPDAAAPSGQVSVRGLLQATQRRGSFGPVDPPDGRLDTLARVDLERLGQQVAEPLYPLYLQLEAQEPPAGDLPALVPPPPRDEGPHLSYAIQWFTFAVMGVGAYGLIIRRTARQQRSRPDDDDDTSSAAG